MIGGRFAVFQALRGGMGEVYLCVEQQHGLPIAVKTIRAEHLSDSQMQSWFRREIATWVSLENHPNIVRCFGVEFVDTVPFMLLEWVVGDDQKGTDLRQWLRRGRLEPQVALEIAVDICYALVHVQQKQPGLVHCDLKPENILITQDRLAKISDFGLATIVQQTQLNVEGPFSYEQRSHTIVNAEGAVGTPPYMAPEQWHNKAIDVRADIYAVGCILFEMLTGRFPYLGKTINEFRSLHEQSPLPELPVSASIPTSFGEVITRCLAKRKEERFANAHELLEVLSRLYQEQFNIAPRPNRAGDKFNAIEYINRSKTFERLGYFDKALADAGNAIQLAPDLAWAYSSRGNTYKKLHRHNEALADYTRALELDPSYIAAYNDRGLIFNALQRYQEALADFNRAAKLAPMDAATYSNRGLVYMEMQNHDNALADFTRAIYLDPFFATAYYNRGLYYRRIERFEDALNDYSQAIRLEPYDPHNYLNRGNVYILLKKFSEAIEDYTEAIRHDPSYEKAYNQRASIYYKLGRYEEALTDYACAIQIAPNNAQYQFHYGRVFLALKRYQDAIEAFNQAEQYNASDAAVYYERGNAYKEVGFSIDAQDNSRGDLPDDRLNSFNQALADYTRAIQLNPANAQAYLARVIVNLELKRHTDTLFDLDYLINLNEELYAEQVVPIFAIKGSVLSRLQRYQEAIHSYEHALKLDPTDAVIWYDKGFAHGALNQYIHAVICYEKVLELVPTNGAAWIQRASHLLGLNRVTDAVYSIRRAAELGWEQSAQAINDLYAQLESADEQTTETWNELGLAFAGQDQYVQALDCYDRALSIRPRDDVTLYNKGISLHDLGRFAEAVACYDLALETNPRDAVTWSNRANSLNALHRFEEAVASCDRALELDPLEKIAWFNKGAALANAGRLREALPCLEKAAELGHPSARPVLAQIKGRLW